MNSSNDANGSIALSNEQLEMLRTVYSSFRPQLATDALSASILCIAYEVKREANASELAAQVQRVRRLLCTVMDTIDGCDAYDIVTSVIQSTIGTSPNSEIVSRLIFECTTLVPRSVPSYQSIGLDRVGGDELASFRDKLLALRKLILKWCFSNICSTKYRQIAQDEEDARADTFNDHCAVRRGPDVPNYNSVLDTNWWNEFEDRRKKAHTREDRSSFQVMMASIRCLLFIAPPSSKELRAFAMAPGVEEFQDDEKLQSMDFIHAYVDIDDEMIRMVLDASQLTPSTSLSIIESLVSGCSSTTSTIISCSCGTIWEMYKIAEYVPELRRVENNHPLSDSDTDVNMETNDAPTTRLDLSNLPRLAHPHLWWRVSSIALIMCSISPTIGNEMWSKHPTLRALIKMTTSQKYRFPTADCSEAEKERAKLAEERLRDQEAKASALCLACLSVAVMLVHSPLYSPLQIADLLFVPPQKKQVVAEPKPQEVFSPMYRRAGTRSSARQREKQDRLVAIEAERKAAALHAETMRQRKLLRAMQKSIMLWDPTQEQRKPPKGSIDVILSANEQFGLADAFRFSSKPDFLLLTIGEGRSAIERAYDWLIPIISTHPHIIDRLQPSSSCFLLLRAYGTEGNKNSELLSLSAPLLSHVSKCLLGEYGEQHSLLSLELLLQDIADENGDRRRCARAVLQEAIGSRRQQSFLRTNCNLNLCGWMLELSYVDNAKVLVPLAVKFVVSTIFCQVECYTESSRN